MFLHEVWVHFEEADENAKANNIKKNDGEDIKEDPKLMWKVALSWIQRIRKLEERSRALLTKIYDTTGLDNVSRLNHVLWFLKFIQ